MPFGIPIGNRRTAWELSESLPPKFANGSAGCVSLPGPRGSAVFNIPCDLLDGAVLVRVFKDAVLSDVFAIPHVAVGLHPADPVYLYGVIFLLRVPYPHKPVQQYAEIRHGGSSGGNDGSGGRMFRRAKN